MSPKYFSQSLKVIWKITKDTDVPSIYNLSLKELPQNVNFSYSKIPTNNLYLPLKLSPKVNTNNFSDDLSKAIGEIDVLDVINESVIITDLEGNIYYWSRVAEQLYGWKREEVVNKMNILKVLTTNQTYQEGMRIMELLQEGQSWQGEFWATNKFGKTFPIWSSNNGIYNKNNKLIGIIGVSQDISERKNRDEKIRFKANMLDTIEESVIVLNAERLVIYWNKAAEKMYGWTREEMIGNTATHLLSDNKVDMQDLEDIRTHLNSGKSWAGELWVKNKNGREFPVLSSLTPIVENEKIISFIGISRDISEIKDLQKTLQDYADEQERLSHELSKQNNDLRQFSYIISHNLRSSLSTIFSLIDLLEYENAVSKENIEYLELMKQSATRLDSVIRDLNDILDTSRPYGKQKETIYFKDLIDTIIGNLQSKIKEHKAVIKTDFQVDTIYALKAYILSILYNLVSNAIKYRDLERTPVIEIKTFFEKDGIMISVQDNGLGIDLEKYKEKLYFERL